MGRQRQGMDRPGVRQVPEDSREQVKMEETGREIICGAPTTNAVKGQVKAKGEDVLRTKTDATANVDAMLLQEHAMFQFA